MQPWEQYPDESVDQFRAFNCYKKLSPPRREMTNVWATYASVADREKPVPTKLGAWSRRFHWRERAAAWDLHLMHLSDKTVEKAVEKERLEERNNRRILLRSLMGYIVGYINKIKREGGEYAINGKQLKELAATIQIYAEMSRKEYFDTVKDDHDADADADARGRVDSSIREKIQQALSEEPTQAPTAGTDRFVQ